MLDAVDALDRRKKAGGVRFWEARLARSGSAAQVLWAGDWVLLGWCFLKALGHPIPPEVILPEHCYTAAFAWILIANEGYHCASGPDGDFACSRPLLDASVSSAGSFNLHFQHLWRVCDELQSDLASVAALQLFLVTGGTLSTARRDAIRRDLESHVGSMYSAEIADLENRNELFAEELADNPEIQAAWTTLQAMTTEVYRKRDLVRSAIGSI